MQRVNSSRTSREKKGSLSQRQTAVQSKIVNSQAKLISFTLSRLFTARVANAFERINLLPMRKLFIQNRMKKLVQNVFKRQDYLMKWQGLQNIKRAALVSQKQEHQRLKIILKKQRGTAIKLLTHFMVGKKRDILHSTLARLRERGQINHHQINNCFRKGIRSINKIVTRKISNTFFQIKGSRVILGQKKKLNNMVRIMKQIKKQNTRWAFVLLRRQMVRDRQKNVKQELTQLDQKLNAQEDQELTTLQNRHKQLNEQLQTVRKEREEIQAKLDGQVKEVEEKQKEMKEHLEGLRQKQEKMKKRIQEIDEQLKSPFTLEEIYQLCYENLLWTIAQNPTKQFNREQLLKSLQVPLVPIDLPLDYLKEENEVLKSLLGEYVLMYGQKKLPPGSKLQLPYEFLLKQNNLLFKMLMTLLPNAQFLREQLHKIRQTYESVEQMVKESASK